MIKLSDRLQMMADLIENGQTVADVGTDHGFLPIYLWESGKSPKVILADISRDSLQKGIDNVLSREYPEEVVEKNFAFKLGDGISVLEDGEADIVTIAGMGGILMTQILGENFRKTKSFKKFILQPRNGQGKLRWWLEKNGFVIEKECLVKEGKFICEILLVSTEQCHDKVIPLSLECVESEYPLEIESMKYEFPESILISNGTLAIEFLKKKLKTEESILKGMETSLSIDKKRIMSTKGRIAYLYALLEKYS